MPRRPPPPDHRVPDRADRAAAVSGAGGRHRHRRLAVAADAGRNGRRCRGRRERSRRRVQLGRRRVPDRLGRAVFAGRHDARSAARSSTAGACRRTTSSGRSPRSRAPTPPSQPVLGYSPRRQAVHARLRRTPCRSTTPTTRPRTPAGQREVIAQAVTRDGPVSGEPGAHLEHRSTKWTPMRCPRTPPSPTTRIAISSASSGSPTHDGRDRVRGADAGRLLDARESGRLQRGHVSSNPNGTQPTRRSRTCRQRGPVRVAWRARGSGRGEIFARDLDRRHRRITCPDADLERRHCDAFQPSIAANPTPQRGADLVREERCHPTVTRCSCSGSRRRRDPDPERQRSAGLDDGADGTISRCEASTSCRTTTTLSLRPRPLPRDLGGENDFPGSIDNELERYGQALDGAPAPARQATTSGCRSRAPDGNTSSAPDDGRHGGGRRQASVVPRLGRR